MSDTGAIGTSRSVLLLNGPNLNLLGEREPGIYGTSSLSEIEAGAVSAGASLNLKVVCKQHNGEGEIVDALHDARTWACAVVYNPGAHAHYSIAIQDAVSSIAIPVIEVHLSNIYAREQFRRTSVIAPAAVGVITGFGSQGYELALRVIAKNLDAKD